MNDRPTPLELIRIANATLASDVLPGAKPEHLYPLRMIANALGIAARELEAHDDNASAEHRGLNGLYNAADGTESLASRVRTLAKDIRLGRFESSAAQETQLRQHLLTTARAKLAAAYPKGLPETLK